MPGPIGAIGTVLNPTDVNQTRQNTIDQEDFIKLFLSQLQFQDPLEPVDNREFLAQLAAFSSLEQQRLVTQNTEGMLVMNSSDQALSLLGKTVQVKGSTGSGEVIAVKFTEAGPRLSVIIDGVANEGVSLNEISNATE